MVHPLKKVFFEPFEKKPNFMIHLNCGELFVIGLPLLSPLCFFYDAFTFTRLDWDGNVFHVVLGHPA